MFIFAFQNFSLMRKIVLLIALFFCIGSLQAQSVERWVIGAAGGSYYDVVNNFQMDFTVGEVAITTISNVNNVLTQGFQQPYTLAWVSVEEVADDPAQVLFYPNPVTDQLQISVLNGQTGIYRISVFDVLGQLLYDERIEKGFDGTSSLSVNFTSFATGNYFVRVQHDKNIIQTSKILKVNQ
jgi:hypothetical protein